MKRIRLSLAIGLVAILAAGVGVQDATAGAVIYDTGSESTAKVALGVNDQGNLNFETDPLGVKTLNAGAFGVAYKIPVTGPSGEAPGWYDATSPGCLCEGWGASATIGGSPTSIFAGEVFGDGNLVLDSFGSTGSTATSSVHMFSDPGFKVTQAYAPSSGAPGVLFENKVTITNDTGAAIDDLRYVRVMDWDIPWIEFSEYVTIIGTATTTLLEKSHDDGFETANPLGAPDSPILAGTEDVDFTDSGPADHGAYFRFNFESLAAGESRSFSIYYGAAGSELLANAAVGAEGIELFSYGQYFGDPSGGTPATYIFGFKGVGGTAVIPNPNAVPVPAAAWMGLGLLGLLGFGRRLRRRP